MTDLLMIMGAIIVPCLIGKIFFTILNRYQDKFYFWERIFIAWGLGTGTLSLAMFYMSLLKINFSPLLCTLFALGLCLTLLLFRKKRIPPREKPLEEKCVSPKYWNPPEFALLLLIICALGWLLFQTILVGQDIWDSWAFWAFKAKIYFVHRTIPFDQFPAFSTVWGNWDYPHHVPLMETWILLWVNYWNDQYPRIIFPLYHAGLAICLYGFFRCYVGRFTSLSGVFLISTLPLLCIITIGTLAEPVVLFYYILSFCFLLRWRRNSIPPLDSQQEIRYDVFFFLSAIFTGLAAWIKYEGLAYAFLNLLTVCIMTRRIPLRHRMIGVLRYLGIIALIISPWMLLKSWLGLKNAYQGQISFPMIFQNLSGPLDVMKAVVSDFSRIDGYNISWIIFFAFLILHWKQSRKAPYSYCLLALGCHLLFLSLFYMILPFEWYLTDNLYRLLLAPTILCLIYSVIIQGEQHPALREEA